MQQQQHNASRSQSSHQQSSMFRGQGLGQGLGPGFYSSLGAPQSASVHDHGGQQGQQQGLMSRRSPVLFR